MPDTFDPAHACIVTATSSGSRGIYGAIGASGEWGLKRGCAVAYTDKGTGNGLHDLMTDAVGLIDGTRTTADVADSDSHFPAALTDAEQSAFNAAFPDRVAFKPPATGVNLVYNDSLGQARSARCVALDRRARTRARRRDLPS